MAVEGKRFERALAKALKAADRQLESDPEGKMTKGQRAWVRRQDAIVNAGFGAQTEQNLTSELTTTIVDLVREARDAFPGVSRPARARGKPRAARETERSVLAAYEALRAERPAWSPVSTAELFAGLEPVKAETLKRLGLRDERGRTRTLALSEIKPFVLTQAAREEAAGEVATLFIPVSRQADGSLASEGVLVRYGSDVEVDGEPQPLAWLRDEADYIAECTGCESAEAVAFLLSDWLPDVPWINLDIEMTIPTVVLRVSNPRATAKEVARAFEMLAPEVFGDRAHKRKSQLQRIYELLTLVAERFPDGMVKDWEGLHAELELIHPHAYKDGASMQVTFSKYRHLLKYIVSCLASRREAQEHSGA